MNERIEARLRKHLAAVDRIPVPDAAEVLSASRRAALRRQRRRRLATGAVSTALVVLAVTVVWVRRDEGTSNVAPVTEPATSTTPPTASTVATAGTDGGWVAISADPRGPVSSAAVVWTGSEALVVGGVDPVANGRPVVESVAYDPTSDTWRRLAGQPFASTAIDPLAAWTGSEMLVIGGTNPDGSVLVSAGRAYEPASDTWRITASPPIGFVTARSPAVWTGTELLVWPGDAGGESMPITPVAYDPGADTWRTLPEAPITRRQQAASVWSGSEWIVWGGTDGDVELADGAAYDPADDSWRVIAASPLSARRVRAVWTGSEMIVAAGSSGGDRRTGDGEMALGDGAAYDPGTDSWRPISAGPAHPGFVPLWTGHELVMFAKGSASVYDVATDRWSDRCCDPAGGAGVPLGTGTSILLIGSFDAAAGGSILTTTG